MKTRRFLPPNQFSRNSARPEQSRHTWPRQPVGLSGFRTLQRACLRLVGVQGPRRMVGDYPRCMSRKPALSRQPNRSAIVRLRSIASAVSFAASPFIPASATA